MFLVFFPLLDFAHWSFKVLTFNNYRKYPRHLGKLPALLAPCLRFFSLTTMAPHEADRIAAAQQTLDSTLLSLLIHVGGEYKHFLVLYDISQLLGTQLDKETLATCIGMIESGVNPEALAVSV